jgi:hypothetical protein
VYSSIGESLGFYGPYGGGVAGSCSETWCLFELRTVALGGSEKQPEVSRGLSVAASGRLSTATDQLPGSAARWSVYGEIVKMLD